MQVYLVGGAVRDQLLGLPVTERDWVVVGASPQQLLAQKFRPVGKDFPVFLHPKTQEEYALARTERKTGRGYTGFSFYAAPDVTLQDDLKRRDFTINAMAMTPTGELIDPFAGQKDLQAKVIRHVSDAFAEDPVRILRAARFMARFAPLGFHIADETMTLMRTMVTNGEVAYLVAERVWQELAKALKEPAPHQFFVTLRECGALKVIFPELDQLFGVPASPEWHPEIDTGIHVLLAIEQAARLTPDPVVRFAAALHDLGKGVTPPELWPKHHGHEDAGLPLVKTLCARLRVPREYQEIALLTAHYHLQCHRAAELNPGTLLTLLEKIDAFRRPQRLQQFLLACETDARGRLGFADRDYPQRLLIENAYAAARAVDVKQLLAQGYTGEELAQQLRQLRIAAIRTNQMP